MLDDKPSPVSGPTEIATQEQTTWATRLSPALPWLIERAPDYLLVLIGLVLISGLTAFALIRFMPGGLATGHVVTFDVIKLSNAERAVASGMLGKGAGSADDALLLAESSKQVAGAITREAGGALVLIKQAVVGDAGLPDITDAVLTDLNLPTNVPTSSNQEVLEVGSSVSPAYVQGAAAADRFRAQSRANGIASYRNQAAAATQGLVP